MGMGWRTALRSLQHPASTRNSGRPDRQPSGCLEVEMFVREGPLWIWDQLQASVRSTEELGNPMGQRSALL